MLNRKNTEPTFEERFNSASAIGGYARSNFLLAAVSLDESGNELDVLAQEIEKEIDRLIDLRDIAEADAQQDRATAARLRSLVDGPEQLPLPFPA